MMGVELLLLGLAWLGFKAFHLIAEDQSCSLEARDVLCLQNMAGGGSRALRRVLAAAWRSIIGGCYSGDSGAANARCGACQSG